MMEKSVESIKKIVDIKGSSVFTTGSRGKTLTGMRRYWKCRYSNPKGSVRRSFPNIIIRELEFYQVFPLMDRFQRACPTKDKNINTKDFRSCA